MSDRQAALARLRAAGIDSADSDVAWLLADAAGVDRRNLGTEPSLSAEQAERFLDHIRRRELREPLQHILGVAWFRHLTLQVGPGVFLPRPETEVLVDLALSEISAIRDCLATDSGLAESLVVVDLCTGSGAIPIALATEGGPLRVFAIEADPAAAQWAGRNVVDYQNQVAAAGSTIELHVADVADVLHGVLDELAGCVDVVTCNPPYIPSDAIPRDPEVRDHDPALALYGGRDGLDVIRVVAEDAAGLLKPSGVVLIEHGDLQGESADVLGVPAVLRRHGGFSAVADHQDLTRRPRVSVAIRNG